MNPLDLIALISGLIMIPFLPAMWREIRGTDQVKARKDVSPHVVAPLRGRDMAVLIPVSALIPVIVVLLALGEVG